LSTDVSEVRTASIIGSTSQKTILNIAINILIFGVNSFCCQYSVWLRAGRTGDRGSSPGRGEDFSSSPCVQTGSGAHPASCTMGTEGPFSGAKRDRGVTLTTHPYVVPRSRMSRSYSSSPPPQRAFIAGSGKALAF
jgi:hypothetical protein